MLSKGWRVRRGGEAQTQQFVTQSQLQLPYEILSLDTYALKIAFLAVSVFVISIVQLTEVCTILLASKASLIESLGRVLPEFTTINRYLSPYIAVLSGTDTSVRVLLHYPLWDGEQMVTLGHPKRGRARTPI